MTVKVEFGPYKQINLKISSIFNNSKLKSKLKP